MPWRLTHNCLTVSAYNESDVFPYHQGFYDPERDWTFLDKPRRETYSNLKVEVWGNNLKRHSIRAAERPSQLWDETDGQQTQLHVLVARSDTLPLSRTKPILLELPLLLHVSIYTVSKIIRLAITKSPPGGYFPRDMLEN